MPIFDVENGKYAKLPKAFVVENGKYVALKSAFVVENGKYVKLWSSEIPGTYVSTGSYGTIATSADGSSWTTSTMKWYGQANDGIKYTKILYGNGVYVASSGNQPNPGGSNFDFKNPTISTSIAMDFAFGAGKFVAFPMRNKYCQPHYSTDGATWTATSSYYTGVGDQLCFVNGYFVTMGTNGAYYSSNGTTWSSTGVAPTNGFTNIVKVGGRFVTIGTSNRTAYYSTNGINGWTQFSSVVPNYLSTVTQIASNGDDAVVVGSGSSVSGVFIDDNNLVSTTVTGLSKNAEYQNVVYGNRFVAVAKYGKAAYSMDGKTWTEISATSSDTYLYGLCFAPKV